MDRDPRLTGTMGGLSRKGQTITIPALPHVGSEAGDPLLLPPFLLRATTAGRHARPYDAATTAGRPYDATAYGRDAVPAPG